METYSKQERYLRLLKMKRLIGRKLKYWYLVRRDLNEYCDYLRCIRSSINSTQSQRDDANKYLQYNYTPLLGFIQCEISKYNDVISELKWEIYRIIK